MNVPVRPTPAEPEALARRTAMKGKLTMNQDWRMVRPVIRLARRRTGLAARLIDISHEVDQRLRRVGNVEVRPSGTLNLNDLPRGFIRLVIPRDCESPSDILCRLIPTVRSHAEVEAGDIAGFRILSARLRLKLDPDGAVLLFLPVIATLDRASFVLLRQPNHQLLLLKLAIEKLT